MTAAIGRRRDLEDLEALFDDRAVGYNLGAGYRFNKWLAVDADEAIDSANFGVRFTF